MLEVAGKKMEKQLTVKEYELNRSEKLIKEFQDEREHLLYQVTDSQQRADRYMAEIKQIREGNAKLDTQLREITISPDENSALIIKEQKELIIELR